MEKAITEAINTTVATFVDKAVTGAIEDTFTLAVDKAVKEKEKALEERLKAMEELFETVQEKVILAQKKAEEDFRCVEEQFNIVKEQFRVIKEEVKALTADIDQAVNEQMIAREATMQKQFDRRSKAAVLRAKIEAAERIIRERDEIIESCTKGWYPSHLYQEDSDNIRDWKAELASLEKNDGEEL